MGDLAEPACSVLDVLDDLRSALHVDEKHANSGFAGDPAELERVWAQLEEVLRACGRVIRQPQPGQGLVSLWLKAVCQRVAKIEKAMERRRDGWRGFLWQADNGLHWLVANGWRIGYAVAKYTDGRRQGVATLLEEEPRALSRLRQLADDCESGAQGTAADGHEVGELVLQAVNDLEVAADCLHDGDFCAHILEGVEFPSAIATPPYLRGLSRAGLMELLERLESDNEREPSVDSADTSETPFVDIDELKRITPRLDRENGEWVSNRKAAKLEGLDTETLGKYRRQGLKTADDTFGRDIYGRMWRREGTPNSHPFYLRRTLRCED